MEAYSALAPYYDEFNRDVPYDDILRFYKRLFTLADVSPQLVLDLACGTGAMSIRLAAAGYEVIAMDAPLRLFTSANVWSSLTCMGLSTRPCAVLTA